MPSDNLILAVLPSTTTSTPPPLFSGFPRKSVLKSWAALPFNIGRASWYLDPHWSLPTLRHTKTNRNTPPRPPRAERGRNGPAERAATKRLRNRRALAATGARARERGSRACVCSQPMFHKHSERFVRPVICTRNKHDVYGPATTSRKKPPAFGAVARTRKPAARTSARTSCP